MIANKVRFLVLLVVCFALLALACGTNEESNDSNDSGNNNSNTVQTEDTVGPTGPYNLKSDGKASPTFSWDAAVDPSGILRYVVRIDAGSWTDVGNTLTYQVNTTGFTTGAHTFEVMAVDAKSSPGTVYNLAFTCSAPADKTAPVISNVNTQTITATTVTVTWTTDEPSTSQVNHGLESDTDKTTTADTNLVTSHQVTITGLSAGSFYYYYVESLDGAGNKGQSSAGTFYTAMQQNLAIGETAQNSEQKVTVRSVTRTSSYKWGDDYTEHAASGKTFVIVDLYVENIGDESVYAWDYNLTISDSAGFKYDSRFYLGDDSFNSVNLFPGQKTQGKVLFEVPTTATGLKIAYDFGVLQPCLATWVV